eukprot:scaffold57_cov254-Pinguiococcus_pyrenoidosus.AAC.56
MSRSSFSSRDFKVFIPGNAATVTDSFSGRDLGTEAASSTSCARSTFLPPSTPDGAPGGLSGAYAKEPSPNEERRSRLRFEPTVSTFLGSQKSSSLSFPLRASEAERGRRRARQASMCRCRLATDTLLRSSWQKQHGSGFLAALSSSFLRLLPPFRALLAAKAIAECGVSPLSPRRRAAQPSADRPAQALGSGGRRLRRSGSSR